MELNTKTEEPMLQALAARPPKMPPKLLYSFAFHTVDGVVDLGC